MKKLIVILMTLAPALCFSQWNGIYFYADRETAMAVINKDTIVAVTNESGRIHRSTNGGQTWVFYQTIFSGSWFLDVHFPTNSIGYACGGTAFGTHRNVIAKTTNGGQTWDSITSNTFPGYSFRKIHFINADTGFVALETSDMLITVDGGDTFNTIPTQGAVTAITSRPDQELFIALKKHLSTNSRAYSILKSADLGDTWNTVYSDTMHEVTGLDHREINEMFFVDNSMGYAVGGNGLFLKTSDGGTTWSSSFVNPYTNLTGLYFISPEIGYINNAGGIYRTDNAGESWTVQNISPLGIIRQIHFANDTVGYALGDKGIYKTSNGGGYLTVNKVDNPVRVTIYPNPTRDKIFIQSFAETITSVVLYNQLGQRIKMYKATDVLDVSSLSKGVYVMLIKTGNDQLTKRFIKE